MKQVERELMTVGELSRRTGLSIKAIREYEALGLIYSAGRSEGNYRLFDETALWCAQVIAANSSPSRTGCYAATTRWAASSLPRSTSPNRAAGATDDLDDDQPPALRALLEPPVSVSVRDAVADQLPLEDNCCDTAVASLVLCTVPDPPRALAELRFFEHVRSDDPTKARVQTWLQRSGVWPALGGGCHCARDTVSAIKAAGFHIERLEHVTVGPAWGPTNPYAVRTAT
jgi:hypothetical protein